MKKFCELVKGDSIGLYAPKCLDNCEETYLDSPDWTLPFLEWEEVEGGYKIHFEEDYDVQFEDATQVLFTKEIFENDSEIVYRVNVFGTIITFKLTVIDGK